MKPIEPGCLALIINSKAGNSGTVTVGEFIGRLPDNPYGFDDWWGVDRLIKAVGFITGRQKPMHRFAREAMLMRIDGHEETETETEEEQIEVEA